MTKEYVLLDCPAAGVKLWRTYQSFHPRLLCARCAAADQDKDISDIDADGLRSRALAELGRTDQIGWYVPAVPCEGGYWGYTSVPDDAIAWWKGLPTL